MVGAYWRGDAVAFLISGIAASSWALLRAGMLLASARRRRAMAKAADEKRQWLERPCNTRIKWVASAFAGDLTELRLRAKTVARELGPSSIDELSSLLHAEHSPPSELQKNFPRLGEWITARHFAIFEVLYNMGPASIPTLKRVAFGQYDWIQGNAIEVLCRMAADGNSSEEIIADLIAHLPMVREEAQIYALGPLLQQSETIPALQKVLKRLQVVPEFRDNYDYVHRDSQKPSRGQMLPEN